jgi:hypothetical protein
MSYANPDDSFALADAKRRLIADSVAAGRTESQAEAFVSAMLAQCAKAWGLVVPNDDTVVTGIKVSEGLEKRRAVRRKS